MPCTKRNVGSYRIFKQIHSNESNIGLDDVCALKVVRRPGGVSKTVSCQNLLVQSGVLNSAVRGAGNANGIL